MFLKSQLHFHTGADPFDRFIIYSPYQAIDESYSKGFRVLSFTHHRKFVFEKKWQEYAFSKGIILIPGVELAIRKKHVLLLNCDEKANFIKTFRDLRNYKLDCPHCLVIAPHPFYPGAICLGSSLIKNIDIFDGIEYSFFYGKKFGKKYNQLAEGVANKYDLPLIGNGDVHYLKYLDYTFSYIEFDFEDINDYNKINLYIKNIIQNIKKNKLLIETNPVIAKHLFSYNCIMLKQLFKRWVLGGILKDKR